MGWESSHSDLTPSETFRGRIFFGLPDFVSSIVSNSVANRIPLMALLKFVFPMLSSIYTVEKIYEFLGSSFPTAVEHAPLLID